MWCNNHDQQVSKIPTDAINGRPKLRPIIPRPFSNTFSTAPTPSCPWNHLLSGKRETISTVPFVSSRWNPTREQLQALEEMYRDGIRTPSAQQIQQIAAKLRRFGKIEGKNVFYWFQNHKARERQKKRRQMESNAERPPAKRSSSQSGLSRTYLETKHPKKLPIPSSCSIASEVDCKELQEHNLTAKRIETWWPLDLSFCMPLNSSSSSNNNKVTEQNQENEKPFVEALYNKSGIVKENKTLQLFPVETNDYDTEEEEEDYNDVSTVGPAPVPTNKFFEFLPIKY